MEEKIYLVHHLWHSFDDICAVFTNEETARLYASTLNNYHSKEFHYYFVEPFGLLSYTPEGLQTEILPRLLDTLSQMEEY